MGLHFENNTVANQWRSQPKIFLGGEAKMFDFRRITLFCLGYRHSKAQNDYIC